MYKINNGAHIRSYMFIASNCCLLIICTGHCDLLPQVYICTVKLSFILNSFVFVYTFIMYIYLNFLIKIYNIIFP